MGNPALQCASYIKPYKSGVIASDHYPEEEAIFEHAFTDCLGIEDLNDKKIFLTEAFRPSTESREITVETMFELFEVDSTYLHNQQILSLYASGLTTGCAVDMGEYSTTVYPVSEGYHLTNASVKVFYGGANITDCVAKLYIDQGFHQSLQLPVDFCYDRTITTGGNRVCHTNIHQYNNLIFNYSDSIKIAREIKEKFGYVSTAQSQQQSHSYNAKSHSSHTLPDGTRVSLPLEHLYKCTDVLFQPSLMNSDENGLHEVIYNSISSCGVDLRKTLFQNIVISGGNCKFKGMPDRITAEMKKLIASNHNYGSAAQSQAQTQIKVNRTSWSDSSTAVWKGGSVIASLSSFEDCWITSLEYAESGANIVHTKCPIFL